MDIPNEEHKRKLLAGFFPALSLAAGRNKVEKFGGEDYNFNMNNNGKDTFKNGWPQERDGKWEDTWLHCDIQGVAYLYVYKLFDKFKTTGDEQ